MLKNEDLLAELEKIRALAPDGILRPAAVRDAVRADEDHPLRSRFTWDADEALDRLQLIEARRLIRVAVKVLPSTNKPVRAYVSLTSDRRLPEEDEELGSTGSYRPMIEVMESSALQARLLQDALEELRVVELKYRQLQELSGVFNAYQEAQARHGKKKTKKKRAKRKKKTTAGTRS
jgi:hypothetical protein